MACCMCILRPALLSTFFPGWRHLGSFFPGFGEADSDGLLAASHFLSAPSALQLAALHLMHRLFDLFPGSLAVSGHWFDFYTRRSGLFVALFICDTRARRSASGIRKGSVRARTSCRTAAQSSNRSTSGPLRYSPGRKRAAARLFRANPRWPPPLPAIFPRTGRGWAPERSGSISAGCGRPRDRRRETEKQKREKKKRGVGGGEKGGGDGCEKASRPEGRAPARTG